MVVIQFCNIYFFLLPVYGICKRNSFYESQKVVKVSKLDSSLVMAASDTIKIVVFMLKLPPHVWKKQLKVTMIFLGGVINFLLSLLKPRSSKQY